MSSPWKTIAARSVVGAGLLAAALFGASKTAEADLPGLDSQTPQALSPLHYRWIPRAVELDASPGDGALARRFSGLAVHLERTSPATLDPVVQAQLDGIVTRASRRADLAVHARDLRTGAVMYDHGGDTLLNPASNQKVLTAAVALDLLGPEYTFETQVFRAGRDLILRGQGDPSLGRDDLQAMAVIVAEQLKLGDVDRLVIDDSAFAERRFGPGFSDEGTSAAHEAPSGALAVDFSTIEVRVAPAVGSSVPSVEVDAVGAHVEVRNEASVGRRGVILVRTFAEGDKTIVAVHGSMSRKARTVVVRRRVLDPGLHAGTVFAARLAEQWEAEPLPVVRGTLGPQAEPIMVNDSAPLAEVLDRGLAYSNNFIAEQVLRTMAWRVFDEPGTWAGGTEIVQAYWAGLGRADGVVIENGSGLTRRGRLTAEGLVDVLVAASHETPELLDALPVSGEPGTLRARLRRADGRVRAKTGTLNGVSGLSGVLTDGSGDPAVAFSILVNAKSAAHMPAAARRRVEDQVVLALLAQI
ncbi:MAG: D-alanyl-D-alanine carboxypeptidase/D-alanyl-D-alanine endopeptidase [Nannocystales bacterium]